MEEGKTSRRTFLGKLLGGGVLTGVVATIGAVFAYFLPPPTHYLLTYLQLLSLLILPTPFLL